MKIGEIAKRTNLPESTLRYYEKRGLLKVERDVNGRRNYQESDIEWIKFIRRLKETGMPLKDIQYYSELRYQGVSTMPKRLKILQLHRKYVLQQQIKWNDYLQNLDNKIAFYQKNIMDKKQTLLNTWLTEEKQAHIKGWDFSHIQGRYREDDHLPWHFKAIIKAYLNDDMQLLDMETGGGEFLLSLNHPYKKTAAIEGYPPNIKYCEEKLLPLGIDFKAADGADILPFADNTFDIITNRHGDYNISELKRLLKDGGLFITQQVGAENDRALVKLLLGDIALPYPDLYLDKMANQFAKAGFEILQRAEAFRPIEFYDVGALVWFAKIIEWEFPNFSVEKCLDHLYKAQALLEKNGVIKGQTHRILLVCRKKG